MKQLRLWLLGLFALCGIAAVAQEAKADSTGYIVKVGQTAPDFIYGRSISPIRTSC